MEHYKILGVDKNASMEEITKAYEDRINKFKEEIEDEKRAKSFIKVFDEAYEKIKEEREQNQQTVIIDNQVKDLNNNFHKNDSNSYESFNEYEQESTVSKEKKRSSSKNTSIRKKDLKRSLQKIEAILNLKNKVKGIVVEKQEVIKRVVNLPLLNCHLRYCSCLW